MTSPYDDFEPYDPDGDVSRYLDFSTPDTSMTTLPDGTPILLPPSVDNEEPLVQAAGGVSMPDSVMTAIPDSTPIVPLLSADLEKPLMTAEGGVFMPDYTMTALPDSTPIAPLSSIDYEELLMPVEGGALSEATLSAGAENLYLDHTLAFDEDDLDAIMEDLEGMNVDVTEEEALMEEEPVLVPFEFGQLDCTNCVVLREVLHDSATRKLFFVVHGNSGSFEHAIFDNKYAGTDSQPPRNELYYINLRTRTHEWVKRFIAQCVEMLHNDSTGHLQDSSSTFCAAVCSDANTIQSDPDWEIHLTSLEQILAGPSFPSAAAAAAAAAPSEMTEPPGNFSGVNTAQLSNACPILESSQVAIRNATNDQSGKIVTPYVPKVANSRRTERQKSALAQQRARIANMTIQQVTDLVHMPVSTAARELGICSTALKIICRKNGIPRWPSRQIVAINRRIKKLEQDALRVKKAGGLLKIKEEIDKCVARRNKIYADFATVDKNAKKYVKIKRKAK